MPAAKRRRNDLIKNRLEEMEDGELRDHCRSLGLNPGPITKHTRNVWVRKWPKFCKFIYVNSRMECVFENRLKYGLRVIKFWLMCTKRD